MGNLISCYGAASVSCPYTLQGQCKFAHSALNPQAIKKKEVMGTLAFSTRGGGKQLLSLDKVVAWHEYRQGRGHIIFFLHP